MTKRCTWRKMGFVFATILMSWYIGTAIAQADEVPSPPSPHHTPELKNESSQLIVSTDGTEKVAHLRIPQSVLQTLSHEKARHADSGVEISPGRTVVAGLALASALAVSGLLLTRGRLGRGRVLIWTAMIGGVGAVLTAGAFADRAPSPSRVSPRTTTPVPSANPDDSVTISVTLETLGDGPIQLSIPADAAARLALLPTTRPSATPAAH